MRIAVVTDQYLPQLGGVPDSVVTVSKGLRKIGHAVRMYAPNLPGSAPDSNVDRLPTLTFAGSLGALVSPFGLRKRLEGFRPDVIHVHSVGVAAFAGLLAARNIGIPAVATCHGSIADYLYHLHLDVWPIPSLVKKTESWYFNHASIVTAPAQKPLDGIIEHGARPEHMRVISNPIDFDIFRPLPDKAALKQKLNIGPRAILLFGRIAKEKNLEVALDIFADIAKRSDAELIVVGDGSYRDAFLKYVSGVHLSQRVRMLGVLRGDALTEAINACEVMLMTSLIEAQPLTILQAAACGLPVVGARSGGVPERIHDGLTGYILEPHDKKGFADGILRLLEDEDLRKKLGDAAQRFVAPYAPERIAQQFIDAYSEAIRLAKK